MSVVVVATITPLPGHADEVVAAFTEIAPAVHAEDGCERYALHRSADKVIMIEKWASREALGVHGKGAALAAAGQKLAGKTAGRPDVIVLDAVPAGDPVKGAL